jgi:hypothetical protein
MLLIKMRHHVGLKIDLILDRTGYNEWPATLLCNSPGFGDACVGTDTPIQQQICTGLWLIGKCLQIDPRRYGGNVGQVRMTVPNAQCHVIASIDVALQQGQ